MVRIPKTYYIRQVQNSNEMNVYWYGETSGQPAFKNTFVGAMTGNIFAGNWADIPGSKNTFHSQITLQVSDDGNTLTRISGDFGGTTWTRTQD